MYMKLLGLVRRLLVPDYGEGEPGQMLALNNRGEGIFAQGLPPKAELTRLGNTWSMVTPAANHFAPVAAMPTTRAEMVLYNGEASKSCVIDAVFFVADTSIAAAAAITLLGQLVPSGTAPTDNTAVLINSRSGKPNYGGNVKRAIANTSYGVADKWEVLPGSNPAAPAASIGASAYAECYGGFIVRPGGLFLANAIAGTAAGTGLIGVVWHELFVALG